MAPPLSATDGMLADVTSRIANPVFVGRTMELATLTAAFDAAVSGQPNTVIVAGEAGVGKSRLVDELMAHTTAAGARVLAGGALELGAEGLPFAPFTAALRGLVRDMGVDTVQNLLPTAAELGGILPDTSGRVWHGRRPGEGKLRGETTQAVR